MPSISHQCPQCGSGSITRPRKSELQKLLHVVFITMHRFRCRKCNKMFFRKAFF